MANQKLNSTITIGAVLGSKTAKTFGVLKGGLGQINKSIKEVTRRQKEIGREKAALLKAGKGVEHLEREYRQLEGRLQNLTAQQNKWTRAIGRTKEVGRSLGRMRSQLVGTFRSGAIAASAYGAAIFGVAKSTAALGDNIAKTADSLGISTDALQELRYAAERSGVETDALDKSLEQYIKRIGEAQEGTGPAADALKKLGLSAADLAKLPLENQLAVIADRMQGVEDQSIKAALANDLFSRNGIALINMLKGGSQGLTQLREDARKTGYVMSEEAARQSEAFNDALLDAELSAKGVKNTIGAALLPVTTSLMKQFSSWVQNNSSQVREWGNSFGTFAERSLPVLRDVVVGIAKVSGHLWNTISLVSNMVGGWQNFGMILGGVFAAKTLLSVGAFVGSVIKLGGALLSVTKFMPLVAGGIRLIGAALAANPIGIAITAIAGGAFLIYQNWDGLSSWFTQKWNEVSSTFSSAWQGISTLLASIDPQALVAEKWASLSSWFSNLWGGVKANTLAAWEGIKSSFLNYTPHGLIIKNWESISPWFANLWRGVKAATLASWESIKSAFLNYTPHGMIYSNWDGIATWFGQKWDQVKSTFSSKWTSIKGSTLSWAADFLNIGGNIIDGLKNGISARVQGVVTTISQVGSQIVSTFKSILGINSPSLVFSQFGGWIMDGLKNGILAKIEDLKATITDVAQRAASWFKGMLGINSPSTVFADFGGWIMEGLKEGILAKFEAVKNAVSGVAAGVSDWFKEKLGLGGSTTITVANDNKQTDGALQRNASGGIFGNRPMIVGERGKEMYFPNRSGYIATNEQLRRMEAMARNAVASPSSSFAPASNHTEYHTYHIHVEAKSGQQATEILREIEKQKQTARAGRLFDQNSLRVG